MLPTHWFNFTFMIYIFVLAIFLEKFEYIKMNDIGIVGRFLLIYNGEKEIVKCRRDELFQQVKKAMGIQEKVSLKYFDDDFQEWINIHETSLLNIPVKAKVSVTIISNG